MLNKKEEQSKMSAYNKKITKVSRGQISPNLVERTDIGLLDTSAQEITNLRISKFGGIYTSIGTKEIHEVGVAGTIAKKYKVSLPDNAGRAGLIINYTDEVMYLLDNTGQITSNTLDISAFLDESVSSLVRVAQQGNLIIISSALNPLLELSIDEDGTGTYDYVLSLEIFDIDSTAILKATTINEVTTPPEVILLSGTVPTDTTGITIGALYLETAPTPPSTTFPWTVKRYDGMDELDPPAPIWTDVSYTADTGETVQYDDTSDTYAWSGTAWVLVVHSYAEDTEYTQTLTPNDSILSGIVDVSIGAGFSITAPAGQDPLEYAKNKLIGVWIEGNNTPAVIQVLEIKTYSISGQICSITKVKGYTLIPFAVAAATSGFTVKFSMQRAFDVDYAGTSKNPEGTSNFPLFVIFYQQRLIIAGTKGDTMQMLYSKQGIYNDFAADYSGNNAFQIRIGGTEQQTIQNVVANQGLQIYTDIAEWIINDPVITALSGFTGNSEIGSSNVLPIISANGTTLFCPKDGLGLIGFIYRYENANFATPQIALLTDIYDNPITDLILKKSNSPNSDNLIFSTLEDGAMVVGNYLSDQKIQAFTKQINNGDLYKQSLQIDDDLFFLVERNGKLFVEIEDTETCVFCAIKNPTYNDTTGEITGLDIYNGREINIYDENSDFVEKATPVLGSYTIQSTTLPTSISCVGYNIHSDFVSNPLNVGRETLDKKKTIRKMDLVVSDDSKTDYMKINGKLGRRRGNLVTFRKVSRPLREQVYTIENDIYKVNILSIDIDYEA